MRFVDLFQVAAVLAAAGLVAGRAWTLKRRHGIEAVVVGRTGSPLVRLYERLVLPAMVLWQVEILAYAFDWPFRLLPTRVLLDSAAARAIGVVLVAAGLGLFAWSLVSFGTSWRIGIDDRSPGALVTTGAFALTRNPIYVFFNAYAVGTFLIRGTAGFALVAAVAAVLIHAQILREEAFLAHRHGAEFEAYRARVPRYLGRSKST